MPIAGLAAAAGPGLVLSLVEDDAEILRSLLLVGERLWLTPRNEEIEVRQAEDGDGAAWIVTCGGPAWALGRQKRTLRSAPPEVMSEAQAALWARVERLATCEDVVVQPLGVWFERRRGAARYAWRLRRLEEVP